MGENCTILMKYVAFFGSRHQLQKPSKQELLPEREFSHHELTHEKKRTNIYQMSAIG